MSNKFSIKRTAKLRRIFCLFFRNEWNLIQFFTNNLRFSTLSWNKAEHGEYLVATRKEHAICRGDSLLIADWVPSRERWALITAGLIKPLVTAHWSRRWACPHWLSRLQWGGASSLWGQQWLTATYPMISSRPIHTECFLRSWQPSVGQEMPCILRIPTVHYDWSESLARWIQHTPMYRLIKININIILPSTPRSSQWSVPVRFF
jgi:hypothetical protein